MFIVTHTWPEGGEHTFLAVAPDLGIARAAVRYSRVQNAAWYRDLLARQGFKGDTRELKPTDGHTLIHHVTEWTWRV